MAFPLFPRLPAELRLLIWSLAIRPPVPGAHLLTTLKGSLRPHPKDTSSAYLHDAGLWSACPESRHVIQRRHARRSLPDDDGYPSPLGVPQHISLDPVADLLVLPWTSFPSHARMLNIGLEFDLWPSIGEAINDYDHLVSSAGDSRGPRATFLQTLSHMADCDAPRKKLWLIDRSVRVLPGFRARKIGGRDEFRDLAGAYVEVEREDCAAETENVAFDLYDFLAQFFEDELRDRRHQANSGLLMEECDECRGGLCLDDDFRLHDAFGILAATDL